MKAIILLIIIMSIMLKDYYKVLGANKSYSQRELKKAYKKMAIKYHPDRAKPEDRDNYKRIFNDISEAYETLSNPELKNIYDNFGYDIMKKEKDNITQREHFRQQQKRQEEEYRIRNEKINDPLFQRFNDEKITIENINNFYRKINPWVIVFYKTREEMNNYISEISTKLNEMSDYFSLKGIDCEEEEEICQEFGVFSTPEIRVFKSSSNKPEDNNTDISYSDIEATVNYIKNMVFGLLEDFVHIVSLKNYSEFINLTKKHKFILFSERKSTPPLIKILSKEFKTYIDIGMVKVNYEIELKNKFNIKNTPVFGFISNANNYELKIFDGENNKESLSNFIRNILFEHSNNNANKLTYNYDNLLKDELLCSKNDKQICVLIVLNNSNNNLVNDFNNNFIEDPIKFISLTHTQIVLNNLIDNYDSNKDYLIILKPKRQAIKWIDEKELSFEKGKFFIENVLSGSTLNFKKMKDQIRGYLVKKNIEL